MEFPNIDFFNVIEIIALVGISSKLKCCIYFVSSDPSNAPLATKTPLFYNKILVPATIVFIKYCNIYALHNTFMGKLKVGRQFVVKIK